MNLIDPDIVETFIELQAEFKKIAGKYADVESAKSEK